MVNQPKRKEEMMEQKFSKQNKAQVWSYCGGTQSCAIAALIVQGKLPAIGDRVRYHKDGHHHLKDVGIVTGFTIDRVRVEVEHNEGLYWPQNLRKLN